MNTEPAISLNGNVLDGDCCSLSNRHLMRHIFTVVLWLLLGAITASSIMFLYQAYVLSRSGVAADVVPIEVMLLDVMEIPKYVALGSALGAAFGLVWVTAYVIRARGERNQDLEEDPDLKYPDVDSKIQSLRRHRAIVYLANRKRSQ